MTQEYKCFLHSLKEFIFNDVKFGLTGKLFIDDFITKERYVVNLPGPSETHYQLINILCASKGYSYYRTNNKIILVVLINEHLTYIGNNNNKPFVSLIQIKDDKKEYYLTDGTKYDNIVIEIECVANEFDYDVETVNAFNKYDVFELQNIIYKLQSRLKTK